MEPIVVGAARGKVVVLLVASLGFVVGGVFMLLVSHRALDRFAGIASIAFFGRHDLSSPSPRRSIQYGSTMSA